METREDIDNLSYELENLERDLLFTSDMLSNETQTPNIKTPRIKENRFIIFITALSTVALILTLLVELYPGRFDVFTSIDRDSPLTVIAGVVVIGLVTYGTWLMEEISVKRNVITLQAMNYKKQRLLLSRVRASLDKVRRARFELNEFMKQ